MNHHQLLVGVVLVLLGGCGLQIVGKADGTNDNVETGDDDASSRSDGGTTPPHNDGGGGEGGGAIVVVDPETGPLCPPRDDLVACFSFDGTIVDGSPKAIAPLVADNVSFVAGREGQAARFSPNPTTSNMRLPFAAFNTPRATYETWLKIASMPPASKRFYAFDLDDRVALTVTPDGAISCRKLVSVTKATIDVWIHVACVSDGTTVTLYVNGAQEASAPNPPLDSTSQWIGIGQESPNGDDVLDGVLDNFRVWSEARTAAEVAASAKR